MEPSYLKSDNISQIISSKILDLLSDLHHCSPIQPKSQNFQYQISTFPYSSTQKYFQSIFLKNQPQSFSACLLECIEGCYPILRIKWKFYYDPSDPCTVSDSSQYSEISRILRCISLAISILPASHLSNPKLQLSATAAEEVQWDRSLQPSNIKTFPPRPFTLQNASGRLNISVEYSSINARPRIISQFLGRRPRLASLDYGEEPKDKLRLNFSMISTEPSSRERLRKNTAGTKLLDLIASESFYEEQEIGFKIIESEISPELDFYDEAEYGHNSFELEEHEEDYEYSDDTQISLYIQECRTAQELRIFSNSDLNCNALVQQWKSSRNNTVML